MKLSSLIGLTVPKEKARILIQACNHSNEIFPHTLLYGIGGIGKTIFARAIGTELNYHFAETHGAVFKKPEQLFEYILTQSKIAQGLSKHLLFFLDEIHRLKLPLQEALYSIMKEWWIPNSCSNIHVSPFTLFAATTRMDMLDTNSFVSRFDNVWEITRYSNKEIEIIIADELSKYKLMFDQQVVKTIAKRCLGIPRIAVNLSKKIRIATLGHKSNIVSMNHVLHTFDLEGIDELGLQPIHHRYLQILFSSKTNNHFIPLGVGAIAAKMRQAEEVIKGSVEPILLELDFIAPTPRGRVITLAGSQYFEKSLKKGLDISHNGGKLRA